MEEGDLPLLLFPIPRPSLRAVPMPLRSLLLLWAILCACAPLRAQPPLTPAEAELAAAAGIPHHLALTLRRYGDDLRRLEGLDTLSYEAVPASGLTVTVEEEHAPLVMRLLRHSVEPGFLVFRSEMNFGHRPDRVALLRASDPFAPVVVMGTSGINYEITTGMVLDRLRGWDARFGVRIVGASDDWVEAEFVHRQPEDMLAFAREVYEFCPDIVDQGTGTVEALAEEMRRTNTLYLWWD